MSDPAPTFATGELARLPFFPLPRVVFFPGAFLPLHIFEQRYRDMVKVCVEGNGAMAIARLKPGYEENYEGSPDVYTVAGAGRIVDHHENPDGTHAVVLQGIARVSLAEQESDTLFRVARAQLLPDEGAVNVGNMQTLIACATQVASVVRERHPEFELGIRPDDEASTIIDTLADRFVADSDERQSILEACELTKRCDQTLSAIAGLLATLAERKMPS
ncbi:MAG: LON peptidase substrate-binding domain-containing protein [Polyangiales bacterium]